VTPIEITGFTIFILVLITGIFVTLLGMPGTVIILVDAILYALFTGFDKIGFKIIIILLLISLLAEGLDFLLNMAGTVRYGTSGKGIWAALIGGLIGAMVMTPVLFGFGIMFGTFLGGFTGVLIVDMIHQSRLKPALRSGAGIILGWFAGILAKGFLSLLMIVITLTNIYS
jgi:uncharacterized protein YqgC (DUF456 family)